MKTYLVPMKVSRITQLFFRRHFRKDSKKINSDFFEENKKKEKKHKENKNLATLALFLLKLQSSVSRQEAPQIRDTSSPRVHCTHSAVNYYYYYYYIPMQYHSTLIFELNSYVMGSYHNFLNQFSTKIAFFHRN